MRNYLSKSCGEVERRQVIHQKFRVEITKPKDLSKSTHLEFDLLCNSGTRCVLTPAKVAYVFNITNRFVYNTPSWKRFAALFSKTDISVSVQAKKGYFEYCDLER